MPQILDKAGNVVQSSRNLAGIRRYVGKHIISALHLVQFEDKSGLLRIEFENGNVFHEPFSSYEVLKGFVRRWRNVYGAPLWTQGQDTNTNVYADNSYLL